MRILVFALIGIVAGTAFAQVAPYIQNDINNQQVRIKNDSTAINALQQQLLDLQNDLVAAQAKLSKDTTDLPTAVNFDLQPAQQVNAIIVG